MVKLQVIVVHVGEAYPEVSTLEGESALSILQADAGSSYERASSKILSEHVTLEAWRYKEPAVRSAPLNRLIDGVEVRGDVVVTHRDGDANLISLDADTAAAALAWIKTWPMAVPVTVRRPGKA